MKHILAVVAASAVLLYSCKKGDNEKLDDNNNTVSDYMPTKAGSWWLYGSNDGSITRRVATGKDSLKEGKVYNYYENTDTATLYFKPEYFGKNGDKFLMLVDLDGSATNYMAVVVNKDNAVLGDTWSNTGNISYSGMSFNLLAEGEVTGVGQTLVINGHTYTDVLELNNKLKAKPVLSPIYSDCGTAKAWFKKGVGIIKADYDIHISSFYSKQYTDSLLDYHFE
jgi:hypothetical protein